MLPVGFIVLSAGPAFAQGPAASQDPASNPLDAIAGFLDDAGVALPAAFFQCVEQDIRDPLPETADARKAFDEKYAEDSKRWRPIYLTRDSAPEVQLTAIATAWRSVAPAYRRLKACQGYYNLNKTVLLRVAELVDSGVLVQEAGAFAKEYLTGLDEAKYLDLVKRGTFGTQVVKEASALGSSGRYDQELLQNISLYGGYSELPALAHTIVGRAAVQRGAFDEAVQAFTAAHRVRPRMAAPKIGLGDVAVQRGATAEAVQHYAGAFLGERWNETAKKKFQDAYRSQHGSLTGAEEMLDSLYEHTNIYGIYFPLAQRTGSASPARRNVLIQYETWVKCGPCTVHDLAVEGVEHSFTPGSVIVLTYHYWGPFLTPGWIPNLQGLRKIYEPYRSPSSLKNCWGVYIDGQCPSLVTVRDSTLRAIAGPGGRIGAHRFYDRLRNYVEARQAEPRLASLQAGAAMQNDAVAVQVRIDSLAANNHPRKLHIVLTEEAVRFPGQEGIRIQRHMVRSIAGDSASGFGYALPTSSSPAKISHTFDLAKIREALTVKNQAALDHLSRGTDEEKREKLPAEAYTLSADRLRVVVYVQDETTGEVLDVISATPERGQYSKR